MNQDEIVICAGPKGDYTDVVATALNEEGIPARIVTIAEVDRANRPEWACTPDDEVYVVIPQDKREAALEVIRWISRVCLNCEAILMPKVSACQRCGTPHLMVPGPFSVSYLIG
jgi:ribosomal protein L40E